MTVTPALDLDQTIPQTDLVASIEQPLKVLMALPTVIAQVSPKNRTVIVQQRAPENDKSLIIGSDCKTPVRTFAAKKPLFKSACKNSMRQMHKSKSRDKKDFALKPIAYAQMPSIPKSSSIVLKMQAQGTLAEPIKTKSGSNDVRKLYRR